MQLFFERLGDVITDVGYTDEEGNIKIRPAFGKEGVIDFKALGQSFLGGMVGGAVMGGTGVIAQIANRPHIEMQKNADKVKKAISDMQNDIITIAEQANVSVPAFPADIDLKDATIDEMNDHLKANNAVLLNLVNDDNVHDRVLSIKEGIRAKERTD